MGYYMSELYRRYFRALDFSELKEEIEHTCQEIRDCLDQTQRRELEAERIRLELEEEG